MHHMQRAPTPATLDTLPCEKPGRRPALLGNVVVYNSKLQNTEYEESFHAPRCCFSKGESS